ncbi:MAG: ribosomal-protein-alanine N-acetyltransferase [Roseivirga sp.]|jgi:ribosomal-protein-alanine N-acetyltransferase
MELIFETKRLLVRKLKLQDLVPFHEMHGNISVMRYVKATVMTYEEDKKDLQDLIIKYDVANNDFWIYAIERKEDSEFIGTIAFVKDAANVDEIGYRFLEKYWGKGYGNEILKGMISYAKKTGFKSLVACVSPDNIASEKMIKNANFKFVENYICEDLKIPENKYILEL